MGVSTPSDNSMTTELADDACMADDRHRATGPNPHGSSGVAISGWLEGTFDDDAVHGELGSIGAVTLIATPGSTPATGWVTIVDGNSDALYGTYRLDGAGVVTLVIVGGTGRFSCADGLLVGSCEATRPRWWVSGSLIKFATHRTTTAPQPP